MYNKPFYALKYNSYTKSFNKLANTLTNQLEEYITIDKDGEFSGECVSFVKAMSNYHKSTDTWIKGTKVNKYAKIKSGTVIATFGNDGKYNHKHTAIFLSKRSDYIWVIDQNWGVKDSKPYIVGIHRIYFSGSGVNNANNYYTVE